MGDSYAGGLVSVIHQSSHCKISPKDTRRGAPNGKKLKTEKKFLVQKEKMKNNPLGIIKTEPANAPEVRRMTGGRAARVQETKAHLDRQWLINPEQFNPNRNSLERERIERTWRIIQRWINPRGKLVVDLGCGSGTLAYRLRDAGAHVTALDASANALKCLQSDTTNIRTLVDCLPITSLQDSAYDLAICTDVIAELPPPEQRLLISEMYRIIKPDGLAICSTALDIDTDYATESFLSLAKTEFEIIDWGCSHHALYMRMNRLLGKVNASLESRKALLAMEKICKGLWQERGISHALWAGKRRQHFY